MQRAQFVDVLMLCFDETVSLGYEFVKILSIFHPHERPVKRIFEQLVLESRVFAHKHLASFLEVVEQEVCLSRFEQSADETAFPVAEELGSVDNRNLYGETSP